MKHLSVIKGLFAGIAFCIAGKAAAQPGITVYEFGINAGFLVYQGDLAPSKLGSFKTQKLFYGLHAGKIVNPSFSVRANLAVGKLTGDEAKYSTPEYRRQRNFNFVTPVTELSAQVLWNPAGKNYADKGLSAYLFAGAGVSFFKIKRDWTNINTNFFDPETSEIWAGVAADSAHTLPRVQPVIPLGGGIKYFISPRWAINAEISYRLATTDYLDGFSHAANSNRKDNYSGYSAGLTYSTGKKNRLGCPVVKY